MTSVTATTARKEFSARMYPSGFPPVMGTVTTEPAPPTHPFGVPPSQPSAANGGHGSSAPSDILYTIERD